MARDKVNAFLDMSGSIFLDYLFFNLHGTEINYK